MIRIINYADSSVTATFWGMISKTAVYRRGWGATLVNTISVSDLRKQPIRSAAVSMAEDSLPSLSGYNKSRYSINFVDTIKLEKAISWAFLKNEDSVSPTKAIVVLYNDSLIYEKYAKGYSASTKLTGWSMAKSITNAMMGIMVKDQRIQMQLPAHVPEWQHDERKSITPANLMQMNSGLHWWGFAATASNQTNMIFKEDNMADYALNQPKQSSPGKVFNYSDGSTNILQLIMRRELGDSGYYLFPYKRLFYKIGMYSTIIEPDASGTFVGSSYVYATARDWARFGLLYQHDGVWKGQRILPEGWVKFSTKQSGAVNKHKGGRYGAGWWINQPDINGSKNRLYGKVPDDCFYAQGYDGQYVWVIPSKKLVVVRLAREGFTQFNPDDFLSDIIKSLPL